MRYDFVSSSSLEESKEGLTMEALKILLPNFLELMDAKAVMGMLSEVLDRRMTTIDQLLQEDNIPDSLKGMLVAAKKNILRIIESRV